MLIFGMKMGFCERLATKMILLGGVGIVPDEVLLLLVKHKGARHPAYSVIASSWGGIAK